ncbi:MAG: YciI family protein [Acidimicrobiales bacterium]|nr:hypothetical protein [Actinomycetota bacterium]
MPQYLLSVHSVEGEEAPTPEVMQQMFADVDAFNAELQESGVWVFAGGLHPADTATVVDGTGVEVVTTDGPFAETKEHLGGFWILELPDLDTALALAAKGSKACRGPVEVRPFQDEPPTA